MKSIEKKTTIANLLPPKNDTCPVCAVKHKAFDPHNCQSLYYQYRFYALHGRWPTWADAIAHCAEATRRDWQHALRSLSAWSEPDEGEPIAEAVHSTMHQMVSMAIDTTVCQMEEE